MLQQSWVVRIEQIGEECLLHIPEEILQMTGWKAGTVLEWSDKGNGAWLLKPLAPDGTDHDQQHHRSCQRAKVE